MTTRDRVNRDYRRALFIGIIGLIVFGGGMWASDSHREFLIVGLSGFALFFGTFLYIVSAGGRCVHCQSPLGRFFHYTGRSELQFCPYCGKSIDDDVTNR